MGIDINWGLLNNVTPYSTYLAQDQQAADAQSQRQQAAQVRSALANYASDPEGTVKRLVGAGALNQASALSSLNAQQRSTDADMAGGKAIASAYGPDGTVNASGLNTAGASLAGQYGLHAASPIFEAAKNATAEQQAQMARAVQAGADAAARASTIGSTTRQAKETDVQYNARIAPVIAQRKAYLQSQAPSLLAQGVSQDRIDAELNGPLDDDHLGTLAQSASHASDILKSQADDAKQAEVGRHNLELEKVDGIRAGAAVTSAGAAVSNARSHAIQANTGVQSFQARKAAGGFDTPGVGGVIDAGSATPPAGSTYIGNGDDDQ